ncbi:MAG: S1 RNA-binding domain-containing protein, partial [Planctomycetes bacterium]|nr:S1 RNA-binding domain-containing protein [Planctomycetota bacterium]
EATEARQSDGSDASVPGAAAAELAAKVRQLDAGSLSAELSVSNLLVADILSALMRPGRDPREDFPPPVFRRGVVKLEDLEPGMKLSGTVLNVVDFGAFVDIGLSDSGLIHISRLADRFVRDPHEVVGVGDVVNVWVVDVDKVRRRVSLTAIEPGTEKPPEPRRAAPRPPARKTPEKRPKDGPRHDRGRKPKPPRAAPAPEPRQKPHRPPKPKFVAPITKAMEDGKEPLRSFSDLMQFYQKKKHSENESQP